MPLSLCLSHSHKYIREVNEEEKERQQSGVEGRCEKQRALSFTGRSKQPLRVNKLSLILLGGSLYLS